MSMWWKRPTVIRTMLVGFQVLYPLLLALHASAIYLFFCPFDKQFHFLLPSFNSWERGHLYLPLRNWRRKLTKGFTEMRRQFLLHSVTLDTMPPLQHLLVVAFRFLLHKYFLLLPLQHHFLSYFEPLLFRAMVYPFLFLVAEKCNKKFSQLNIS